MERDYQTYYPYLEYFDEARIRYEYKIREASFKFQLNEIKKMTSGRCFLDVGAGPGYFCKAALMNGFEAWGIEISKPAVRMGEQFLGVRYCEMKEAPTDFFDVLNCSHVLEHLKDLREALVEIRSKLKDNGILFVKVPHQESLTNALKNLVMNCLGKSSDKFCDLYLPDHLSGFDCLAIKKVMQITGFETIWCDTRSLWSRYYDPFFIRNYVREKKYLELIKRCLRGVIDNTGVLVHRGAWVVGFFRKR